jgi:hypothetical protein
MSMSMHVEKPVINHLRMFSNLNIWEKYNKL